ncbi:Hypothetical protein SCLAV_p1481 (plasmid) [Streptomyces clavuligerus]|uniref:Uncharacterized protein n=1 Tax=Streptomyces clavuligerus TaxID=1901 RepID=B5GLV5_STRCL|nr:hypothetical protein SSCG_00329 [Streptomyces clavuligerus]EFG04963.1 Hypothetical protein SCLAV_p1481 [Streptomyces clavuligerus]
MSGGGPVCPAGPSPECASASGTWSAVPVRLEHAIASQAVGPVRAGASERCGAGQSW